MPAGREMDTPRVSVVLPVFNAIDTLPRAVDSLLRGTFGDFEIVAVDDGSGDGSGDWLARRARDERRLRVVRRGHEGLVSALNAGLAAARGGYVARMDADDESRPERLASQVAFLEAHRGTGVAGCLVEFGGDARAAAGFAAHVDWVNSVVTEVEVDRARFIEAPFAHPSVMFRRDLVEVHGGYRAGDFPEDYELWLRWLEAGVRMAKVPEVLLRWNDAPGRLSRTDPRYGSEAFYRLKAGFLARWLNRQGLRGRRLVVWGAGRRTRRRVDWLEAEAIRVDAFIDIDPRKQRTRPAGRRVIGPEALPPAGDTFVLGYVGSRGARDLQRRHLNGLGYVEGTDYLFAA